MDKKKLRPKLKTYAFQCNICMSGFMNDWQLMGFGCCSVRICRKCFDICVGDLKCPGCRKEHGINVKDAPASPNYYLSVEYSENLRKNLKLMIMLKMPEDFDSTKREEVFYEKPEYYTEAAQGFKFRRTNEGLIFYRMKCWETNYKLHYPNSSMTLDDITTESLFELYWILWN